MRLTTQDYNDISVLEIQGDFDTDSVSGFHDAVLRIVNRRSVGVVLELTQATGFDSRALEEMLWARDYCAENTCQLRLAGVGETCSKIMEITRLATEFDRYSDLAEAVRSFA